MRAVRVFHSGVVAAWRDRDRSLRDLDVDVTLIAARVWNEGGQAVALAPEVGETWVTGAATWGRHPYRFVYDPRPIWRALRASEVEVLDVHEEPASLAAAEVLLLSALARRGRPAVCLYSAQNIAKRYPPPFRWLERLALRRAAAVHTCNEAAGEVLRSKGFTGIIRDLGLGVDVERFRPGGGPAQAPAGSSVLRVGYVGRLERHKGVDVLVRAVARMPDVELTIVGDGPTLPEVRALVAGLGIADRVRISGFTPHHELPALYRGFDVVAVPSLDTPAWIEQFGRVAVEAMASGVAVVVSDSGSLPEVVGDAGVLVAPGDVDALADALRALADHAVERRRLSALGPERAARYSWPAVAARQRALYEEMLG